MMTFDQKVEAAAVATGGLWSVTTILCFATGRHQYAYSMLAFGAVVTTALALIRVTAAPGERLPGDLDLARE